MVQEQEERHGVSDGPGGGLPAVSVRVLRGVAVRRLLALRREGKLTTGQVRSAADVLGVRERAVWRWLAAAERDEAAARAPGSGPRMRPLVFGSVVWETVGLGVLLLVVGGFAVWGHCRGRERSAWDRCLGRLSHVG